MMKTDCCVSRYLPVRILMALFAVSMAALEGFVPKADACPPPPECKTPDAYEMWAKKGSQYIARSNLGEKVWLAADSAPHDITYEMMSLVYVNGSYQPWVYNFSDCGTCNVNTATFTSSGGTVLETALNYRKIRYNTTPLNGSVTGKHNGWSCAKSGYGSYIIPGGTNKTMTAHVVKASIPNVDVTQNCIEVRLEPASLTGTMKLYLIADSYVHTLVNAQRSSGLHVESFNIPTLPENRYYGLVVNWHMPSGLIVDGWRDYIGWCKTYEISY